MQILIYSIICALAIVPGIVSTVLRKRLNWRASVHWIMPLGLPLIIVVLITINSIFTSHDDSQFAFGLAALAIASIPFAALYGLTVWITQRILESKKTSN